MKFQYNKLAALVGQFDDIVKNTALSINSQGKTLEMAGQQLDTIARKAGMLKATLIDTFSGAGDSGLRTTIKGLIDVLNQFTMGLNKVSPEMINLGLTVGAAVIGWKALSATFAVLTPIMASVTGAGAAMEATMGLMATGEISATVGAVGLEAAMSSLAIETAVATGGLSLLVGGLAYFIYHAGQAEKAEQNLIQKVKDDTAIHQQQLTQYQQTAEFLKEMSTQYNNLSAKLSTLKKGTNEYKAVNDELTAVKQAVITVTDDETKKTLGLTDAKNGDKKITNEVIDKLIELENQHTTTANKLLSDDAKLTEQAITNATLRVTAIQDEISALQTLAGEYGSNAKPQTLHFGKWDLGIPVKNPLSEVVNKVINGEIDKQQESLKSAKNKVTKLKNDLSGLQLQIAQNGIDTSIDHAPGSSESDKEKKSSSDYLQDFIDNTLAAAEAQGRLNDASQRGMDIMSAKNDLYQNMTSGDMWKVLEEQQEGAHKEADLYRAAIIKLESAQAQCNLSTEEGQEVYSKIGDELDNAKQKVDELGLQWIQLETKQKELYDEAYQDSMSLMQHEVSMGRMSTEEQIKYLEQLRDAHTWTMEQMWENEEKLYTLRKEQMDSYLDDLETSYNEELARIKENTNSTVAALQSQLDALDTESTSNDRVRAEEDHNSKIAELNKELAKEKLRTGQEHRDKEADLQQQIADENLSWQRKREDWELEDKKSNLQDKIDAAKDAGEEEQDNLKDNYDKAKKITSEGMNSIINAIAAKKLDFETTGKNLITALINGMLSGDFSSVTAKISELTGGTTSGISYDNSGVSGIDQASSNNPIAIIGPSEYVAEGNRTYMTANELASILGTTASWNANNPGVVTIGGKKFSIYSTTSDNHALVGINEVATALGYGVQWDAPNVKILPKAHTGALTMHEGLAVLKDDERVLSPQLTLSFDRLASAIIGNPSKIQNITTNNSYGDIDRATNKIVAAIERKAGAKIDKFMNIENYNPDAADLGILSRELAREIGKVG